VLAALCLAAAVVAADDAIRKPPAVAAAAATAEDDAILKDPAERQRVEAALPAEAPAKPLRPRRLLIFDRNVGYGGHGSIPTANYAFKRMGEKTGAFETVISRDPAVFRRDSLSRFDAVFLNNTVGNLFADAELRRNLQEFVCGGGGLMGVHGTSVGFTQWPGAKEDWPEFARMIGARGAAHRQADERVLVKLDDPAHPLTRMFGGHGFEYRDEFFRVHDPYSRKRVRVLLSMDTDKFDPDSGLPGGRKFRADKDYALAWVRSYGRGRTFYCTIAHNPAVFWDAKMLRFYLSAIQFALGDLEAPTTPSAALTPAAIAQEKLGWRIGVEAYTFHKFTFFETIDKTAGLGLNYVGGLSFQKVSAEVPRNFDPNLGDDELSRIRLKLDDAGLRLLTYYIHDIPADEAACRRIFEFGRKMGIETFMSEPKPEALDVIAKCCDEYGINVALHNHDAKASPGYWNPEGILKACDGRTARLGAAADVGYWIRAGVDPIEAVRKLKGRLITVQMHDLHERSPQGHDVPWGSGAGKSEALLREIHRLGLKPTMIGLEYSYNWTESLPDVAKCAEFFNALSVKLAQ